MKLVATSDFRNPRPSSIDHDERQHESHIHKGARFDIGGDLPLEKLSVDDKKLISLLNSAGRIVEASQTDKVKAIDAEVAQENKRLAAAKPAEAKK
jgi:hypothetical protein